jgi:trk system potassium uptake protein TrkA
MKVIVCGAGQVGFNIARYLSNEKNQVTVIDHCPDRLRKIGDSLDVRCVLGAASHPTILEKAGADDADMIIAVTLSDEVNMVACEVAHSLFQITKKIARIRHPHYLDPLWGHLFQTDHLPIDVIISPELEVAQAILNRLNVPGTTEVIPLVDDHVRLLGVLCTENTPLINTSLRQLSALFPDLNIVVIAIIRSGKTIIPSPDDQILEDDEVLFVVDTGHVERAMFAFGHEESAARKIIIFGGGNIGHYLAQKIEQSSSPLSVKIIEINLNRAEEIALDLKKTIILHGDVLDVTVLDEAGVDEADTVIAVTDNDEVNILSSLLAKKRGCKKNFALSNRHDYGSLMPQLGIDVAISPSDITVSTVLHHVRGGKIRAIHSLRQGFGELLEADVQEGSSLISIPLKDLKLPTGVIVGAIVREGQVINPRGSTMIQVQDRIILFSPTDQMKKVEKIFSFSTEYI